MITSIATLLLIGVAQIANASESQPTLVCEAWHKKPGQELERHPLAVIALDLTSTADKTFSANVKGYEFKLVTRLDLGVLEASIDAAQVTIAAGSLRLPTPNNSHTYLDATSNDVNLRLECEVEQFRW